MRNLIFLSYILFPYIVFGQIVSDSVQMLTGEPIEFDSTAQKKTQEIIVLEDSLPENDTSIMHTKTTLKQFIQDTVHSPGKAALFSAVLPGLGQIYNDKWWKVPIVYAGLGVTGAFIISNSIYYNSLKDAAILRFDGDSTTIDEFSYATDASLLSEIDLYKRYVDLSWIAFSAVYLLNIIDAVVDAHLYDFDVSDDLSLHVDPYIYYDNNFQYLSSYKPSFGLKINLHIK